MCFSTVDSSGETIWELMAIPPVSVAVKRIGFSPGKQYPLFW